MLGGGGVTPRLAVSWVRGGEAWAAGGSGCLAVLNLLLCPPSQWPRTFPGFLLSCPYLQPEVSQHRKDLGTTSLGCAQRVMWSVLPAAWEQGGRWLDSQSGHGLGRSPGGALGAVRPAAIGVATGAAVCTRALRTGHKQPKHCYP